LKNSKSLIASIIQCNCPKCRQGTLFKKQGLFIYSEMLDMHEHCMVCNQKFEIEPGFWIGAMWISYPIVVAIELPFLFLALVADGNLIWVYFGLMIIAFLIFWPLMLRLGRSSWAHICIRKEKQTV
jgi:hypothetical protein